jgi:hypothetical protein
VLLPLGEAERVGVALNEALAELLAVADTEALGSGSGSGVGAADAEGPRPSGMTPVAGSRPSAAVSALAPPPARPHGAVMLMLPTYTSRPKSTCSQPAVSTGAPGASRHAHAVAKPVRMPWLSRTSSRQPAASAA